MDVALTTVLPTLLAAVVGGGVVHLLTRRRDAENERRKLRLEYLFGAYRSLAQTAHRDTRGEVGERFERALDDIVLLGSQDQIAVARQVANELSVGGQASIDGLLVLLRRELRAELDLPDDGLDRIPTVRFGTASPRESSE